MLFLTLSLSPCFQSYIAMFFKLLLHSGLQCLFKTSRVMVHVGNAYNAGDAGVALERALRKAWQFTTGDFFNISTNSYRKPNNRSHILKSNGRQAAKRRYHCFPWYATFEIKTPAETFPKFPSIIHGMFACQIPILHKRSRKFTSDK